MTKAIIALFAHPDDEAISCAGLFLKARADSIDTYLVTLTMGENGQNPDNVSDLGEVRNVEWRRAGELLGIRHMVYYGFRDGQLNNADIDDIVDKFIKDVLKIIKDNAYDDIEIVSFGADGYSGHMDHIVASHSAQLAYYRLKQRGACMRTLTLVHRSARHSPTIDISWRLMPPGITPETPGYEVIDGSEYFDDIRRVIRAHHSQRQDGERYIHTLGSDLGNVCVIRTQ